MPLKFANSLYGVDAELLVLSEAVQPTSERGAFEQEVYGRAGSVLEAERKSLGALKPGTIFVTKAYQFEKFVGILHFVAEGLCDSDLLEGYKRLLVHAEGLGCASVAIGWFGPDFRSVLAVLEDFLSSHDLDITLCYGANRELEPCSELFGVDDESGLAELQRRFEAQFDSSEKSSGFKYCIRRRVVEEPEAERISKLYAEVGERIKALCEKREETFSEMLLRLIDESGRTDAHVYRAANIDRRHFSKIRSDREYAPSKSTVLALAIALELDLDTTKVLLLRAGFALSCADIRDEVVRICIERQFYNINEINILLFKYNESLL